ncbi:fimbrial protein [Burkholderia lata]|uniref:fimbrial protein n=1 Tax=Burkholderia lata (strain ATCC 17760 / DSM 23089 / LMG 22485 / NCIMB 9086 / R18194 / 383) TaxID=482957 RepID=UPI001454596C|nr:fimbrial protein [Burkholderia lata]VWC77420.1 fimbrial protein [Burkholderia lata]
MTFNKHILAIAAVAATFATGSAQAADGQIQFEGKITAASCTITGGSGANVSGGKGEQLVKVKLGTVSSDSIPDATSTNIAAGTSINLNLDCGNTAKDLTTVKLKFDPMSGSGVDTSNNKLLKVVGGAEGVGIGIYDTTNKLLDLAANDTFDAPLVKGGTEAAPVYTAALNMRAGYVKNGATFKSGDANGTLPFTLSYE